MNNLNVVAVPLDIAWADVDENLCATARILSTLQPGTDLVVLPELFSTGYISSLELLHKYAEPADQSPTLSQLHLWARKYNFAIAGSLLVREGDALLNRGFFIEPSGDETFYDKAHLFCLSDEARHLTRGTHPVPTVRFRGWNIALAICYDLRFPAWLRNKPAAPYDLLVIPANWPAKRSFAWQQLLSARSIENQAYVVGTNRSGRDDTATYGDGSSTTAILSYTGRPLGTVDQTRENIVAATLDRQALTDHRGRFPFLDDADSFRLNQPN